MEIKYKGHSIFAFSDTHGYHQKMIVPPDTEILICAGDVTSGFSDYELKEFFRWYASQPANLKIFVAGNHEIIFDLLIEKAKSLIPDNVVLLENSGITYKDINFYAAAARSWLHHEIIIPEKTDFFITHGPAEGILDNEQGCLLLRKAVFKSKPQYHIFGHVHELGFQMDKINDIRFCNVSYFNKLTNR
ncbi:MAG: metallophosphoesterase [Bacteroidales bacterium]